MQYQSIRISAVTCLLKRLSALPSRIKEFTGVEWEVEIGRKARLVAMREEWGRRMHQVEAEAGLLRGPQAKEDENVQHEMTATAEEEEEQVKKDTGRAP
nr:unnamed protein product [Spirometra erinaceieuropaei]